MPLGQGFYPCSILAKFDGPAVSLRWYIVFDMSGILDNKTRILDSIVTLEGRRQLANGGIKIRYVTFSDAATFYAADVVSGSADATARIYLEACHLPQDQITFRADDSGRLLPFGTTTALNSNVRAGQLLQYNFEAPDPSVVVTGSLSPMASFSTVRGENLHSLVEGLLTSSIDNFKKMQAIATRDTLFDDDGFGVGTKELEFVITEQKPIPSVAGYTADIDSLEDIFSDPRLSRLPNFKFLPPINRVDDSTIDKTKYSSVKPYQLGYYTPWNPSHVDPVQHKDVIQEHIDFAKMGYVKTVNFDPTSRMNNLFIQAFEVTNDTMFKLDIIDFGTWYEPMVQNQAMRSNDVNQPGPTSHIFFVGKLILKPESNTHAFVHLFTLLFG